jgi:hypothetical protein
MTDPKPTKAPAKDDKQPKDAPTFTDAPDLQAKEAELEALEERLKAREAQMSAEMKALEERLKGHQDELARSKKITIGRDSNVDELRRLGYLVAANQNPRPRDRKIMIGEGWKRLTIHNGEIVEDADGVWAMLPQRRPDGLLDRTRPFRSHRCQTGCVHEQGGLYFNAKGLPIERPSWLR